MSLQHNFEKLYKNIPLDECKTKAFSFIKYIMYGYSTRVYLALYSKIFGGVIFYSLKFGIYINIFIAYTFTQEVEICFFSFKTTTAIIL